MEIQRRLSGATPVQKGIKQAEIETLLEQKESVGEDKPEGDFFARTHPIGELPPEAEGKLDRLVLVHRLREVIAQIGFTRFEASMPKVDGELDLDIELAPIARDLTWLPAIQNRGEGVFLSFTPAAINDWRRRDAAVKARKKQLVAGFDEWKRRKDLEGFNDEVLSLEEQPVRIPLAGKAKSYVPDVLIHYRPTPSSRAKKAILAEVKTAEDLEKNKAKYANKFAVAKRWAASKGWVFQTRSDKEIRSQRLAFLKFLREYHYIEAEAAQISRVLVGLRDLGGHATYTKLLRALCPSEEAQLTTIPVIWHLVATRQIVVDLNQAISDEVVLELPKSRGGK